MFRRLILSQHDLKLIGLTGFKRSGKTTAAEILESHGFHQMSFADPLKRACKEIFQFNDDQLYGNSKENFDPYWGCSARQIMQIVGSELFRNHLPSYLPSITDIWIRAMERNMIHDKIVIADVRFPDEIEFIRRKGGIIIKLVREGCVSDGHISEKDIDCDIIINNNGSVDDLRHKLVELL